MLVKIKKLRNGLRIGNKHPFRIFPVVIMLWKSLGKLPFLNVGEGVISQSKAIERYLAARFKMMWDTMEESALIDSHCGYIRDFKTTCQMQRKSRRGDVIKIFK